MGCSSGFGVSQVGGGVRPEGPPSGGARGFVGGPCGPADHLFLESWSIKVVEKVVKLARKVVSGLLSAIQGTAMVRRRSMEPAMEKAPAQRCATWRQEEWMALLFREILKGKRATKRDATQRLASAFDIPETTLIKKLTRASRRIDARGVTEAEQAAAEARAAILLGTSDVPVALAHEITDERKRKWYDLCRGLTGLRDGQLDRMLAQFAVRTMRCLQACRSNFQRRSHGTQRVRCVR